MSKRRKAVLDASSERVAYYGADHTIHWINAATARALGRPASEVVGRRCYEVWSDRSEPCEGCPVERARDTGMVQIEERQTPDGRLWLVRAYPLVNRENEVAGFLEFGLDIDSQRRTEQQLRESEDRFRLIIGRLPEAVFAHHPDGKIVLVNERACDSTGYSEAELLRMSVHDIDPHVVPRDDAGRFWHRLHHGDTVQFETTHRRKDGSEYPVEILLNRVTLHGQPLFLAVARDLTERHEADRALRESETKYKTLVESSLQGVYIVQDNRIVFANEATSVLTGRSQSELLDTTVDDLAKRAFFPEDIPKILQRLSNRLTGSDEPRTYEVRIRTRSNEERWVQQEVGLISYQGRPAIQVFVRDITHQKFAEERLRESEEWHSRLLNVLPVGVYAIDAEGLLVFANERAEQLWGRRPRIGEPDERFCGSFRLYRPDGSLLPHDQTPMAAALQTGECFRDTEVVIEREDGSRIHALVNIDPLRDEAGSVVGAINAFTDVTQRKLAEERLRESERFVEAIANTTPSLTYIYNVVANRNVWVNETLVRFMGDMKRATSREVAERIHPDDMPLIVERMENLRSCPDGQWLSLEYRLRGSDGSWRWMHDRATVFGRDTEGNMELLLGSAIDVTERIEFERAQQEHRRTLQALLDASQHAIFLMDCEGRIIECNGKLWQSFASSKDAVIDKRVYDFLPAEIAQARRNYADQVIATGQPARFTDERDGRVFEHSIQPIVDESGCVRRLAIHAPEITHLKETESALRVANQSLEDEKRLLEDKNIALRELMNQLRQQEIDLKRQLQAKIDQVVMPLLARLEVMSSDQGRPYVKLLRTNLQEIVAPVYNELFSLYRKLTPREIEVCTMIRDGMSSKDMADTLNVSPNTIFNHRRSIRRKLKLLSGETNLSAFLRSLGGSISD